MSDRWLGENGVVNFVNDVGPRPSPKHSMDRFPDQKGNYEPGNVRWATPKQQARNKTNNHLITHSGKTLCLAEWSERTGLSHSLIINRLKRGWSVDEALTTPKQKQNHG